MTSHPGAHRPTAYMHDWAKHRRQMIKAELANLDFESPEAKERRDLIAGYDKIISDTAPKADVKQPPAPLQKAWDKIRTNSELPLIHNATSELFDPAKFKSLTDTSRRMTNAGLKHVRQLIDSESSAFSRSAPEDVTDHHLKLVLKAVRCGVQEVAATDRERAMQLYLEFADDIDMAQITTTVDQVLDQPGQHHTIAVNVGPLGTAALLERLPALYEKWTDHRTYFGKDANCGGLGEDTLRYYYRATRTWEDPPTRQTLIADLQDPVRQSNYLYPERISAYLTTPDTFVVPKGTLFDDYLGLPRSNNHPPTPESIAVPGIPTNEENRLREKVILNKFPEWTIGEYAGSGEKVYIHDGSAGTIPDIEQVSRDDAEALISERKALLDMLWKIGAALNSLDPATFDRIWYGGKDK